MANEALNGTVAELEAPHAESTPQVSVDGPIRLDIGGGPNPMPGWINVDRRNGMEAYPLPYPDNSVDEVRASHVLEHFPMADLEKVVKEWVRVLKPGARIRIAVPDIVECAKAVLARHPLAGGFMYGGQTDENDFHRCGMDRADLTTLMFRSGLVAIGPWKSGRGDCADSHVSLNLEGYKPTETALNAMALKKVAVCMSVPRLGFSDNFMSIVRVLSRMPFGEFDTFQGAFWNQCLERCISKHYQNCEWILTCDYDTLFGMGTLARLMMLFDMNPQADALAPLQLKRAENGILCFCRKKEEGGLGVPQDPAAHFAGDIAEVDTAHFGLTLIRSSALKKMAHPWFEEKPNKDGKWEEGRIDSDIGFWHKFKAAGNRVFIAPRVPVGHIQSIATWPSSDLKNPVFQYAHDYWTDGTPPGVMM